MKRIAITVESDPDEVSASNSNRIVNHIRRHPVVYYTLVAYLIPWIGSFLIAGPKLLSGEIVTLLDGLYMWLTMLAGPSVAGISVTYIVDGKDGLTNLFSRMKRWRNGISWYAVALFLPPILILFVLTSLSILLSPVYAPGFFTLGVILGLITGFFEEIGWMGFLYPTLRANTDSFNAAVGVGLIHGVWHLMAGILGSSQSLGIYFIPYFISMWMVGMTAMRVLQVWVYNNTDESVLMIQLMHGSSTGFLLALTPVIQLPVTETTWFLTLAVVLWIVASIVIRRYGRSLTTGATS
ncbi:MAG: CPBP family intramembrane metalloprotease [Candidatus Thorarchaeota archaeon]|nr:MAG: CPBP family intramembrane metalloprotease [Candidatus Thorarchaeota archaeon]